MSRTSKDNRHSQSGDGEDLASESFGDRSARTASQRSDKVGGSSFWGALVEGLSEMGSWIEDPLGWVDEPFSTKQLFNPLNPLSPF